MSLGSGPAYGFQYHTEEQIMNSESIVRTTLKLSVPLNFIGAYLFAFPSSDFGKLIEMPQNAPLLHSLLLSFLIFLFGIIYGWLARHADVFQPLLFVGGFAKICFFIIGASLWLCGDASGGLTSILVVDLTFGAIWLWAYRQYSFSPGACANTT